MARRVQVQPPEAFPEPVIREATIRDCQVVDQRGNIKWVRCILSNETNLAYCFIRTLRECIFGVVKLGITLEFRDGFYRYRLDRQVAIKCMSKSMIRDQRGRIREDPMNELSALQMLAAPGHLHVQQLLECLQDAETVYSICPYYTGGELFSFLENHGTGLAEDQARVLFCQIITGLDYIHSKSICHRDMSLENILLDRQDSVIIDMGMCLRVPRIETNHLLLIQRQGQCGKLTYMAPEIFLDHDFDGFAVDMWSCGIILFILLAGVPPLEIPTDADPRYKMISSGRINELLDMWNLPLSNEARDLLQRLLRPRPSDRLNVKQVLQHPWITR